MRTAAMRQQHHEILAIVGQVAEIIRSGRVAAYASAIRSTLNDFDGKLNAHLETEERTVYPTLEQHRDAQVRQLADHFSDEMGNLLETIMGYSRRWQIQEIASDPVEFAQASKFIFAALEARVDREDHELYPLVDRA